MLAALISCWLLSWRMDSKVTIAAIAGCAVATLGLAAGPIACLAAGILSIIHGFNLNHQSGGGGNRDGPVKRSFDLKIYHPSGYEVTSYKDLPVDEYSSAYVNGIKLDVYRHQNNHTSLGYALGSKNGKRDTTSIWGIGADEAIDSGSPSDDEYQNMAVSLAQDGFQGQGGTACTTLKDGDKDVYMIKFVLDGSNGSPDGSPCSND